MGTSSSHEVRQMVDEAVVALRSGQPQLQQHQPFRRKKIREVISLDDDIVVLDEVVVGGGNDGEGYHYIDYDTDGAWEPGWSSDSDTSACEEVLQYRYEGLLCVEPQESRCEGKQNEE
ncbi:hypothetical protein CSHISOI_00186 [Colletotrichum shisoi]|uniref:Uncharacterized protein n=1 Tax=Colletotrichum shisoi TaxID=2078593 RepID=A0A5Q4CA85_9PEZI|nr:hypothetical protein CSHISOI_00186 [Colletotrichum shisoi]